MTKEKSAWDTIPSLEGLEVDWQYEPENPLGKRAWMRLVDKELVGIFGVKRIPLKIAAKNFEETGVLLDVGEGGCCALLQTALTVGQAVKLGFLLGKEKVISKATVKNVTGLTGGYRTGVAFVELDAEMRRHIAELMSSKAFHKPL